MAVRRPPGNTNVRIRNRTVNWKYRHSTGDVTSESSGSETWAEARSWRPLYGKGVVILLPGGIPFRKATPYSHESLEVGDFGPASLSGFTPTNGLRWAEDGGRDGSLLISSLTDCTIDGISTPTDARNEAVTKALNKIADQKINLGESLATFGQTLRMFTSRGEVLLEALKFIRRDKSLLPFLAKRIRDLRREGLVTAAASRYLEYIYGLKPLMDDVYTGGELLKGKAVSPMLLKAVGYANRTRNRGPRSNWKVASYSRINRLSHQETVKVKCTLWARADPNYSGLRALNQLGLVNPASLAWDLVSYSFVVDWFVPVGPVLSALTAPMGLLFVDGTIATRASGTLQAQYFVESGGITESAITKQKVVKPANIPITYEGFGRTVLSSWPRPGFWVATDPFKADRPLKALALGIVALSGSKPPIR